MLVYQLLEMSTICEKNELFISELTTDSFSSSFLVPKNEVKKITIENGFNNLMLIRDFPNLEELEIKKSEISDITPISELQNLRKISINNSNIKDITPIKKLYNLKSINFSGNKIESANLSEFNSNQAKANFIKCSDSINVMRDLQQFRINSKSNFKSKFLTKTLELFDGFKDSLISSNLKIGSYLCEQLINFYTNSVNERCQLGIPTTQLCELLIKYKGNYDKIKISDKTLADYLICNKDKGKILFSPCLLDQSFILNECIYEINACIKDTYNFSNYIENRPKELFSFKDDHDHHDHDDHNTHNDHNTTTLSELILDNNKLTTIDKSVNCDNLFVLSLNNNKLTDINGLRYVGKRLKTLDVGNNELGGVNHDKFMRASNYLEETQKSMVLMTHNELRYMLCITLLYEMSLHFNEEDFNLKMIT